MKEIGTVKDVNLKTLGERLSTIDHTIVALIARRMAVVNLIGKFKAREGKDIVRPVIELQRIRALGKFAKKLRLDQTFIRGIMHAIINEACKRQLVLLEARLKGKGQDPTGEEERNVALKSNLLELTEDWSATYDQDYDRPFFATHSYLEFEAAMLSELVSKTADRELFVDLGCATGRCLFNHRDAFASSMGYDLSKPMLEKARAKINGSKGLVHFIEHDLDHGIPLEDKTVSMIVMSMGTASDVHKIESLIADIERVLKIGGRFLLSFYNAEALLYSSFFPWETGLAAHIDLNKHCLTVHKGDEEFEIYARAYQPEEARLMLARHPSLQIEQVSTYPTLGAVLPKNLLEEKAVQKTILSLDQTLSSGSAGAYILVTGVKQ